MMAVSVRSRIYRQFFQWKIDKEWITIRVKQVEEVTSNLARNLNVHRRAGGLVENECPVIVSSVLLHHLVNCDLVREEGGEKKQEEGEGKE